MLNSPQRGQAKSARSPTVGCNSAAPPHRGHAQGIALVVGFVCIGRLVSRFAQGATARGCSRLPSGRCAPFRAAGRRLRSKPYPLSPQGRAVRSGRSACLNISPSRPLRPRSGLVPVGGNSTLAGCTRPTSASRTVSRTGRTAASRPALCARAAWSRSRSGCCLSGAIGRSDPCSPRCAARVAAVSRRRSTWASARRRAGRSS